MKKSIFRFKYLLFCVVFLGFAEGVKADKGTIWKSLPIQHEGRVKPFDTFSRETLRTVYGKESFQKRDAVDVILSWLIIPDYWETTPFIQIEQGDLKKSLGLKQTAKRFSPRELKTNQKFILQIGELQSLRQKEADLDSYFKNLEKVEIRLRLYESVKSSWLLRLLPKEGQSQWLAPFEMDKKSLKKFQNILNSYVDLISKDFREKEKSIENLKNSMEEFKQFAFGKNKNNWYQERKIKLEIFYNQLKPFQVATFFYLLFLLFVSVLSFTKRWSLMKWLLPLVGFGFLSHSLGLFLRSYIMSRPPVSNMYETVVWVPWVALVVGFIFYLKKSQLVFIASVILACFCLFLVNTAPHILDSRLQPLEAVLRSSFWLSTHVLIITMSYSFFFLAFVLGDMGLIDFIFRKKNKLDFIKKNSLTIYRCIQWGVILLAAGTILGGIWADYSWGRFWGWDPKESWALISLLGYLALLHGRFVGWIRDLSLFISAVLMFFLVVMAWYGVNFILGKGLHSYGFGSGGWEYVLGFFTLHIIFCGIAAFQNFKSSH
ncbi:MAG: cytochrome c biogenesis protein CcsA [Bdellovibrionales bacterium]